VKLTPSELLDWKIGKEAFCAPAPGITATVTDDTCELRIAQGATAQLTRQVQLTAADSAGAAREGQVLGIDVGIAGRLPYATVTSDPVTVVSAPAVDLVLHGGQMVNWSSQAYASVAIEPRALQPAGYSAEKGVSTGGSWQAVVDVSAFPADTLWGFNRQVLSATNGELQLSGTGSQNLAFLLPGEVWPEQEEGSTVWYDFGMQVAETSFASADYLNNGDGWQPGTGISRETSTYDPARGSIRGYLYPNNDYTAIRVFRPIPVDGVIFQKMLELPQAASETLFEDGNILWSSATTSTYSLQTNPTSRAAGVEFNALLSVNSEFIDQGGVAVIGDVWNHAQARAIGPVTVLDMFGQTVDPAQYEVQWSAQATNSVAIADATDDSDWVTTAGPLPNANAVRVIFEDGVIEPGTGAWSVRVPMQSSADYPETSDPIVRDTMWGSVGDVAASAPGALRIVWPTTPTLTIEQTVDQEVANPGDHLTYSVTAKVKDPHRLSDGFVATITAELDRCEAAPVNNSDAWQMTVIDAVVGPSGRVCGDPESTPAKLVFTPAGGDAIAHSTWSSNFQQATLPNISYSARTTLAARDAVATNVVFELDEMGEVLPAGDSSQTALLAQSTSAAHITADQTRVEIDEPLSWSIELVQQLHGATAETVIALPRNGDDSYWQASLDPDGLYTGEKESDFTGSYAVNAVTLSQEDSSVGVELWFTTGANPSLDPAEGTWHRVSQAGVGSVPALAGATALKLVAESRGAAEAMTALVNVELRPEGNAEDDVYLMWVGETTVTGGGVGSSMPWPAQSTIVMSEISGTVWSDEDYSASMQADEPRIEGVELGLFEVHDGVTQADPIAVTTTDGFGAYEFASLHSGRYEVAVIARGNNLAETVTSYYGEEISVDTTFSFLGQRYARSSQHSTQFTLGIDTARNGVDFGFFAADPLVDVDKSPGFIDCVDGVCEVTWNIEITNLGNSAVSLGSFTDTVSSELYDVEALFGVYTQGERIVQVVARDGNGGYALSESGYVYSWVSGNFGSNANGTTEINLSAQPVQALPDGKVTQIYARDTQGGYALTEDGEVYAWGTGLFAGNGNGNRLDSAVAVMVQGLEGVSGERLVTRGYMGAFALTTDGKLYSWGSASDGSSGTGLVGNYQLSAAPVHGLEHIEIIDVVARESAGGYALSADGKVYSWGGGTAGANGNGSTIRSATAQLVQGLEGLHVERIYARYSGQATTGGWGGFAVTSDGEVYSWGAGLGFANANGAETNNLIAQPVGGLAGVRVTELAVVDYLFSSNTPNYYALTDEGKEYSW
ncbi:MAG: hypothetical protein GX862_10150, partial [Leucobacter sp.]|nr:hypothetical protein [Leucobacter sp.]